VAAWSDHLMGEFLAEHPESLEDEHYDVDEVRLADELTGQQQAELRALVREYSDIFATTDVPPASTAYAETFGAVDAVSMLKEGATRFPHASPPQFQQHHAVCLAAWTQRLVLYGVLVRHPRSPVASRALVTSRHSVMGRKPRCASTCGRSTTCSRPRRASSPMATRSCSERRGRPRTGCRLTCVTGADGFWRWYWRDDDQPRLVLGGAGAGVLGGDGSGARRRGGPPGGGTDD
jgi:hypothetical protein